MEYTMNNFFIFIVNWLIDHSLLFVSDYEDKQDRDTKQQKTIFFLTTEEGNNSEYRTQAKLLSQLWDSKKDWLNKSMLYIDIVFVRWECFHPIIQIQIYDYHKIGESYITYDSLRWNSEHKRNYTHHTHFSKDSLKHFNRLFLYYVGVRFTNLIKIPGGTILTIPSIFQQENMGEYDTVFDMFSWNRFTRLKFEESLTRKDGTETMIEFPTSIERETKIKIMSTMVEFQKLTNDYAIDEPIDDDEQFIVDGILYQLVD